MKYVVILADGMADEPMEELDGMTVMEAADTPYMDQLAKMSEIGLANTVPLGMAPGSDTANLSVLGYDPQKYYSGRSPLEALSIGVPMTDTDIALRCNIVTVSEEDVPYAEKTIIDHSSSEITTEECAVLLDAVKNQLETDEFKFYQGTSYRHCTVWRNGKVVDLIPPHDILGKKIGGYLPTVDALSVMMEKSYDILKNHPINIERKKRGLNPANSCWFWGAGTRPKLTSFEKKTGKSGVMISAVDLLKGIAVGAEMTNIIVPGANGTLHTDYVGKAKAATKALIEDGYDFAYIHVEAPDEMGHQGSMERKIQAIENIDKMVLMNVYEDLKASGEDFRILVTPDHPTPIRIRTHISAPVPYMIYDSTNEITSNLTYNEKNALKTTHFIENGYQMIDKLFEK